MLFEECLQQNQVVKRQAINHSHGSFTNPIYLVSSSAGSAVCKEGEWMLGTTLWTSGCITLFSSHSRKSGSSLKRLLEEAKEHSYWNWNTDHPSFAILYTLSTSMVRMRNSISNWHEFHHSRCAQSRRNETVSSILYNQRGLLASLIVGIPLSA